MRNLSFIRASLKHRPGRSIRLFRGNVSSKGCNVVRGASRESKELVDRQCMWLTGASASDLLE